MTTAGQKARFHLYTVVVMVAGRTATLLVLVPVLIVVVLKGSSVEGMVGTKLVELGGTGMVIVTSVENGSTVVVDAETGPTEPEELDGTKGVGVMDPEVGPTVRDDELEAELGTTVVEEVEEVDKLVVTGGINFVKRQCVTVFGTVLVDDDDTEKVEELVLDELLELGSTLELLELDTALELVVSELLV